MKKYLQFIIIESIKALPSYTIIETKRVTFYDQKNDHGTLWVNGWLSTIARGSISLKSSYDAVLDSQDKKGRFHLSSRRRITADSGYSSTMTEKDIFGLLIFFSMYNAHAFSNWMSYLHKNRLTSYSLFNLKFGKTKRVYASDDFLIPTYAWPFLKRIAGKEGINCFSFGGISDRDFLFEVEKCSECSRLQALASGSYILNNLDMSTEFARYITQKVSENSIEFLHKKLLCKIMYDGHSEKKDIISFLDSIDGSSLKSWWDVIISILIYRKLKS